MLFRDKVKEAASMNRYRFDWSKAIVYFAFVAMFILFAALLGDYFFSSDNLLNITRQTASISVMAVAMTFVIGAGGIDLSVGSITALSALITALILSATNNIFLAILGGIFVGAVVGSINGLLVTVFRMPSFLVTLGTMGIIRGLAMRITDTAAVPIYNSTFIFIFGGGDIGGIPTLLFWTLIFLAFGLILLNKMPFGKKVLATGGNEVAASFSGINTKRVKYLTFLMSGIFAAFAGMLYAGKLQTGRYTYGENDALSVIAAVIIGGTSMAGGTGSVLGAVIGSILMGMINNGLIIGGFKPADQMIIRGAILIVAVALGSRSQKKK